ncbi:MAG: alkene reductase [Proteobacteria bacterium]|nr:MAG: alkene reductase [Pseudomonadota bacterium]
MTNPTLFTSLQTGPLNFKNRIFMAPMTRSRAPKQVATDLMAEYYAQRASAGLIFTEGTQVSEAGVGYIGTPGIHSESQVEGWKKVTSAVHAKGGLIFAQLWHVGRVSHPDFHKGQLPVAPSAVAFEGQAYTPEGFKNVVAPRALSEAEILATVADFKKAAESAKRAGFDGVEVHGANGYLPAQFLEDGSNKRTDQWGGTIENRARFLLSITDAAISVWGPERVSVRISPRNPFNGMNDSNPEALYLYVAKELQTRKVGILHLMEGANFRDAGTDLAPKIREVYHGTLILNNGYDQQTGETQVSKGLADAIAYGALFIPNPDLPERFAQKAQLNAPDHATFYGGDAKGYTDYSRLA